AGQNRRAHYRFPGTLRPLIFFDCLSTGAEVNLRYSTSKVGSSSSSIRSTALLPRLEVDGGHFDKSSPVFSEIIWEIAATGAISGVPAIDLNSSPARCSIEPTPACPQRVQVTSVHPPPWKDTSLPSD